MFLEVVSFGAERSARVEAAFGRPKNAVTEDASWNARLILGTRGRDHDAFRINPRRLGYIPLVFYAALAAASPLPGRRKLYTLLIGSAVLITLAALSVVITAAWAFTHASSGPPGVELPVWVGSALTLLYGFVTPLANKFIVPLVLAVIIVRWQLNRTAHRAAAFRPRPSEPHTAHSPAMRWVPRAKRRQRARH